MADSEREREEEREEEKLDKSRMSGWQMKDRTDRIVVTWVTLDLWVSRIGAELNMLLQRNINFPSRLYYLTD